MFSKSNKKISQSQKNCSLIFGIVYSAVGFFVHISTKNPYSTIHTLGIDEYIPPLWIFNLLSLFWLFESGRAAGRVCGEIMISRASGKREIAIYQGFLFFTSLFFMSLCWYPLFFGTMRIGLSLLVSVACVVCSVGCGIYWSSLGAYPTIIMFSNAIWLFYMMIVNLLAVLSS